MSQFKVQKVYYTPGLEVVTIAVQATDGPFAGTIKDLYTTQAELGADWGDDAVYDEASALLGAMDAELTTPAPAVDA